MPVYNIANPIVTIDDVRNFVHTVYSDYRLNIHPDDDFSDLVNISDKTPALSLDDASLMNSRMAECIGIVGDEIYDLCYDALMSAMELA